MVAVSALLGQNRHTGTESTGLLRERRIDTAAVVEKEVHPSGTIFSGRSSSESEEENEVQYQVPNQGYGLYEYTRKVTRGEISERSRSNTRSNTAGSLLAADPVLRPPDSTVQVTGDVESTPVQHT
eukprot:SAG11_NODE_3184_length_2625_cov_10.079572_1_plen_125_part_10